MAERWWIADRAEQFRQFAATDGLTAPLYRVLAEGAAEDPEVLGLLDVAPPAQQRTVLLLAAVHFTVLGDPGCDLARYYRSVDGADALDPTAGAWPTFRAFCLDRRSELEALIGTRSTQTNETGRCAAVVPALELVHRATGRALSLLEVGASAGLNLAFDRYRIDYSMPSWSMPPWPPFAAAASVGPADSPVAIQCRVVGDSPVPLPAPGSAVPIADRAGLDLVPGDVTDEASVRWLEACIFADRVDRLDRLRSAVGVVREDPPRLVQGDMVADLGRVAATVGGDGPLVVIHSWALTYVDDAAAFGRAMAELSVDRDLWWLSIEPSRAVPDLWVPPRDARYAGALAANTVTALAHVRPDGRDDQVLARSHPHLDWIHWLA